LVRLAERRSAMLLDDWEYVDTVSYDPCELYACVFAPLTNVRNRRPRLLTHGRRGGRRVGLRCRYELSHAVPTTRTYTSSYYGTSTGSEVDGAAVATDTDEGGADVGDGAAATPTTSMILVLQRASDTYGHAGAAIHALVPDKPRATDIVLAVHVALRCVPIWARGHAKRRLSLARAWCMPEPS
jgi:hypothetical protein